jgi:hypothetical protein
MKPKALDMVTSTCCMSWVRVQLAKGRSNC